MRPEDRQSLFKTLAPVVYGRYWKTDIARHHELSRGAVTKWINGVNVPIVSIVRFLLLAVAHNYFYNREKGMLERKRRVKPAAPKS